MRREYYLDLFNSEGLQGSDTKDASTLQIGNLSESTVISIKKLLDTTPPCSVDYSHVKLFFFTYFTIVFSLYQLH